MNSHDASRSSSARAAEDLFAKANALECTDTSCFQPSVEESIKLVQDMVTIARGLQDNFSSLTHLRGHDHQSAGSMYMQTRQKVIDQLTGENGVEHISAMLDGEMSADTLAEAMDAMRAFDVADQNNPMPETDMSPEEIELVAAWRGLFISLIIIRVQMLDLAVKDPYTFKATFNQQMLSKTQKETEAINIIAAQDISRGPERSIILRVQNDPDVRVYDGQSMLGLYMYEHPGAPQQIREYIRCMAMGVQASGGRVCELVPGQNGLCQMDADNIDLDLFPSLKLKIESTLERERKTAVAQCTGWAKSVKYPRVYDVTYDATARVGSSIKERPVEERLPSKRASRRQSAQQAVDSEALVADAESERGRVSRWLVRGSDGALLTIGDQESDVTIEEAIDYLIENDTSVRKYLRGHDSQEGLVKFFEAALRAIISPDEVSSLSIERLFAVKGLFIDGEPQKAYRLSGAKLVGVGGGKVANETRILFTARNDEDVRSVTIRGVVHRGDSRYGRPGDFQRLFF